MWVVVAVVVARGTFGCCRLYEGKETAEFQRSLQRLFQTLNQLMKSTLEGPTLLSQVWWGAPALVQVGG